MEQFRVLVLVSLAIMTLNSCNGQNNKSTTPHAKEVVKKVMNDTILISKAQFKIVRSTIGVLDIEINENNLVDKIADSNNPILRIELDGIYATAKGNNIFSSSVPNECDYFYPLGNDNKVTMKKKGILNLREIE